MSTTYLMCGRRMFFVLVLWLQQCTTTSCHTADACVPALASVPFFLWLSRPLLYAMSASPISPDGADADSGAQPPSPKR